MELQLILNVIALPIYLTKQVAIRYHAATL